jgi:hypothetical protein
MHNSCEAHPLSNVCKKSQVSVPLASIQRFDFCQAPHSFVTKMFYLLVSLVTNREFVGGFHKRKMQRRALAQGQKDAQEKQVRLEEKKQVHNIDLLSGGLRALKHLKQSVTNSFITSAAIK